MKIVRETNLGFYVQVSILAFYFAILHERSVVIERIHSWSVVKTHRVQKNIK